MEKQGTSQIANIPVKDALDYFLSVLSANGLSEKTIRSYKSAIEDFIEFAKIKSISEITQSHILNWINYRLKNGFEKRSIEKDRKRRIQITMHYYTIFVRKWLVWAGLPKEIVPLVKKPQSSKVDALTKDEVERLFRSSRDILDILILSLLFETGLRANELLSITYDDIDLGSGEISVRNAKYGKERVVFLGPISKKIIEEVVSSRGENLAGQRLIPLSYNGLYKRIKALAKRANLPPEKVRPHVLRHTFATEAVRRGISLPALQKLLGHSDIKVTQIYTHLLKDDLKREYYQKFAGSEQDLALKLSPEIASAKESEQPRFNFCPNCGKRIPPYSKFCPYCGFRIIPSEGVASSLP